MRKFHTLFVFVTLGYALSAQIPTGYYSNATGTDATLKTQLYNIIKGHTVKTYDELWTAFATTDKTSDNKVWDMYSNCPFTFTTNQCGSTFTAECQCYNREHSFPKSWFGGDIAPMYTDLFHLYPTDGYVNNRRSNFPFGTVVSPIYISENRSKLGTCSYPGYAGTVFEPVDQYKGDFARSYFYMATRYENVISGWNVYTDAQPVLDGARYPCFDTWFLNLLLEWNAADPVSQKETDRNNAVYAIQHNRNPYIDHPEYVEAVWPYPEPANNVTNYTATAISNTSVMVTWTDAGGTPLPTKYLVKAVFGTGNPTAPTDGIPEMDADLVKNVTRGFQQVVFTGLTANAQYTFQIWPYNHAGSVINYKTNGAVPSTTVTTTPLVASYTWTGATNNDWSTATNWNPNRTTPATSDILTFGNGQTITVTGVPTQTIGGLWVTGDTKVTLQTAAANNILSATDRLSALYVTNGSELNISGSDVLTIAVSTGSKGNIYGGINFTGSGHRLTASDEGGITFNNGAIFTAGTSFTGNAFGNSGTTNSVVFASGSTYIANAGANPFGTNAGICKFETGSLYKHQNTTSPSFSGRTYADFELNIAADKAISPLGISAVSINNLTVTNGTLNFNMTSTPGHTIKGNITIGNQAALKFSPTSVATIALGGTAPQTITVAGTLTSESYATLLCSTTQGISIEGAATLSGPLTVASGSKLTVTPEGQLTANGTLTNSAGNTGLVVESGGSLLTNSGVGATVKRYVPAAIWSQIYNGWHLFSSPVAAQQITDNFTPTGTGNDYDFYCWYEPTQYWVNFKDNALEPKFTIVNGPNFVVGKGYLVAYQKADVDKSFEGTLNNTNVNLTLTKAASGVYTGWNLLGNPYPSAIKWNDPSTDWALGSGIVAIAKQLVVANGSYSDIGAGGIIPAENGFFVQTTVNNVTLTIPLSARVHNATPFFKSKSSQPHIELVAAETLNHYSQECIIYANEFATNAFDPEYDSHFLAFAAPQLYSLDVNNEKLSTNVLPDLNSNRVIELGFLKNDATEYTLTLKREEMITGLTVFLTDKKTHIETNLTENPVYSFTAADSDAEIRFALHFLNTTALQLPSDSKGVSAYLSGHTLHIKQTALQGGKVYLYNPTGIILFTKTLPPLATQTINLPKLSPGLYILSIKTAFGTQNQKVVISH